MGRHSEAKTHRRKEKAHPILRGFFLATVIFVIAVFTGAYTYAKYLEAKINDYPQNQGVDQMVTKPIGDEPINILVMGSDARSKGEHARTDTMIIMRMIPGDKRVVMISIPRDLRVEIPEHGMNKINAAHAYGGPELAIKTIKEYSGLDIHHYIEVQFWGFKRIVDALGGVTIDVEKPMVDRATRFGIPAGVQRMDGDRALNYVRFRRDSQGDFGRMERQQKFFQALLAESLRFRSFFKLPSIINIVANNTQSDMNSSEMLGMAAFVARLSAGDFETVSLPGTPRMINGISYVVGDDKAIQVILNKVKNNESLTPPPPDQDKNQEQGTIKKTTEIGSLKNGDITLAVLNGCGENGIAKVLSDLLEAKKFCILEEPKNANGQFLNTVIYYKPGMRGRADVIAQYFASPKLKVNNGAVKSEAQVVIIVGNDHKRVLSI